MRRQHVALVICAFITSFFFADAAQAVYHPTQGRWVSRDPIAYADGMSLHQYARSAPPVYIDDTGAAATSLGEAMQGFSPRPAAPPAEAVASAGTGTGGYGLQVSDAGLRAGLQKMMNDMCPCFKYQDDGNGRIAIVEKFPPDADGTPSRAFCCCYYQHLPGCNLIMKYRDEGGKAPFPTGQDFTVVEGAAWRGTSVMGVHASVPVFSHETIHGVFGLTQTGQFAVDAGQALITGNDRNYGKGARQSADRVKETAGVLSELTRDRAGCSKRPEFGEGKQGATPQTSAAQQKFQEFQDRAKAILDRIHVYDAK